MKLNECVPGFKVRLFTEACPAGYVGTVASWPAPIVGGGHTVVLCGMDQEYRNDHAGLSVAWKVPLTALKLEETNSTVLIALNATINLLTIRHISAHLTKREREALTCGGSSTGCAMKKKSKNGCHMRSEKAEADEKRRLAEEERWRICAIEHERPVNE